MRPMRTLRGWQFDQLRRQANILRHIVERADKRQLTTLREKPEGWTVAEVIGHLLDCERLFVERAKLVMEHDMPDLPFPPQDEDVRKGRYNECDPSDTLDKWKSAREEYMAYLKTIPEDSWGRQGKHPKFDPLSLNDQLALVCGHTVRHTDQIVRILEAVPRTS